MKASPNSFPHGHRTLRQFGFELFTLLMVWSGSSRCFTPSLVGDLESAVRSSGERWEVVTSGRFLSVFVGYFLLPLALYSVLEVPTDIPLEVVKVVVVALLFFVAFFARSAISVAHAAAQKITSVLWSKIAPVCDQFTDYLPPIYTPPPILLA